MAGQEVNLAKKFSSEVQLLATTAVGAFDGKTARMDFTDAEEMFWEQLGGVYAKEITEARGQQTYDQLSHFRRKVYGNRYEVQLEIDKGYELQSIADFRGPYVGRATDAYKERYDIEAIKAAFGTAYTGKNGTTVQAFDWTNQAIGVGVGAADGYATAGLTKQKLIQARSKLKKAGYNLMMPQYEAIFVHTQDELDNLLAITEVTSRDYGDILGLMSGEVSAWLGWKFCQTELVPFVATSDVTADAVNLTWTANSKGVLAPSDTDSTSTHACFGYVRDNMGMSVTESMNTEIDKLVRNRHNWGLSMYFSVGGVRRQEDGIVFAPCDTVPNAS